MPQPVTPDPVTWVKGGHVSAPRLRSDVANALALLSDPPAFTATQTGAPAAFTASSSADSFTAPGTAYLPGTAVTLTGSSLPGGVSAGTTYWVVNPSADVFQLATSQGGSAVSLTSDGSGTVRSTQVLQSGSWQEANLDTLGSDAWGGHLPGPTSSRYYGMFPGWYIAEATVPVAYTSTAGAIAAGIACQQDSGGPEYYAGQRTAMPGITAMWPQTRSVKLVRMSAVGSPGAAGNDWVAARVRQSTGSAQSVAATSTQQARLQVRWVAALSGGAGLPVPDNDPWPQPPDVVTAAFLNKNLRDTIAFLACPPLFEARFEAASPQSLASQTSLPVTGTAVTQSSAVTVDNRTAWDTATSTWTAPVPGVYHVYGLAGIRAASSSLAVAAGLTVTSGNYYNGTTFTIWGNPVLPHAVANVAATGDVLRRLRLNAGDTIRLAAFQADSSSAAANLTADTLWAPRLITVWAAA